MTAATCPICARALGLPALRSVGADGDVIAPGRHVERWGHLNATEQLAMLSLISAALQEGAPVLRPGQIEGHFILRLNDNPREAPSLALALARQPSRARLTGIDL